METFAKRLKRLREAAGLTQEGLAKESGVPLGSIRMYEQGHREPYWHVVPTLAKALGIDLNAFAEEANGVHPQKRWKGAGK